jgi:hypothetical protein
MLKRLTDKHGSVYTVHKDVGVRFARLTVLSHAKGMYTCACDCGNITEHRAYNVRSGAVKACTSGGYSNHTEEWRNEPITTPDLTIDEVQALINRAT